MVKKIYSVLFLIMCSVNAYSQTIVIGDMNNDSKVDAEDVTEVVNTAVGKTAKRTVSVSGVGEDRVNDMESKIAQMEQMLQVLTPSSIVGTWYDQNGKSFSFYPDGWTNYKKHSYFYEYLPLRNCVVLYEDEDKAEPQNVLDVIKNSDGTLILRPQECEAEDPLLDDSLALALSTFKMDSISIADLTADQMALFNVSIDTTIFFGGMEYHLELEQDVDVPVKFEKDLEIPIDFGSNVTVPVQVDADAMVDLSDVHVNIPTIVVTGNSSGTGFTTDWDGNLSSVLVVPVQDADGNIVGYTNIPLDQINVNSGIDAVGRIEEGTTITLDGTPIAKVQIEKIIDADVEIHDKVTYHLVIDETVKTTVKVDKWVRFGDYRLRKDENGNVVYDANGNPIYDYVGEGNGDTRSIHIWVNRDMKEAAESLWGTAQDAIWGVKNQFDKMRDLISVIGNRISEAKEKRKTIKTVAPLEIYTSEKNTH